MDSIFSDTKLNARVFKEPNLLKVKISRTGVFLSLLFIFFICSPHCVSAVSAENNYIKIGLRYESAAPYECTLSSNSGFILGTIDRYGFHEGMPLPGYNRLTISVSGRYPVIYADDVLISDDFSGNSCIMPYNYVDDGYIAYESNTYRGGFSFAVNRNSTINIINDIDIEDYLYSVLSGEMGRSSPIEALKAQAVAARSYAICGKGTHSDYGFDLCTTSHCQVYCGRNCEYNEINKAVDETAGEILLYQGQPVPGYYYKNSGGQTQNSEDVWNDRRGYLRSVKDSYSPDYPWYWRASFQEIRSALLSSGEDPGVIRQIAITKRNQSGYVGEIKITGSRGSVTLSKEQIRTVLGYMNVKSSNFAFDTASLAAGDNSADRNAAQRNLYVTNGDSKVKLSGNVSVISNDGNIVTVNLSELSVISANLKTDVGDDSSLDIDSNDSTQNDSTQTDGLIEVVTTDPVVFRGSGYGHGVGMPQDSAIAMAKQGFDYISILEHYFTDVEISDY